MPFKPRLPFLCVTIIVGASHTLLLEQFQQEQLRAAQHPLLAATSGSPKRLVTAAILNNFPFDYSS